MLDRFVERGRADALTRFKISGATIAPPIAPPVVPPAAGGGFMGKAKEFGQGQWGAAKDLFANLRGGLGGKANPDVMPHADPAMMGAAHRGRAIGNLKTLAPSLLAGGGLYLMHRHNQDQEQQLLQIFLELGWGK